MRLHVRLALWTGGLLAVAAGVLAFWITRIAGQYQAEVAQRLNAGIAMYVTQELALIGSEGVNETALKELAHRVMTVNPSAEVYLLDTQGSIVATLVPSGRLQRRRVDLRPIRTFLSGPPTRFIAGDDPTAPEHRAPFSVAPVSSGSSHVGYLYVILGGQRFDSAAAAVSGSYALKTGLAVVAFILLLTLCVGAVLFSALTLPLRTLSAKVRAWTASITAPADGGGRNVVERDELTALSCQFESMARQIERQIEEIRVRDQQRRELIATISHDLRTPLASLHGYLETILLKDETLSRVARQQYLEVALRHSERVERLIAALFELSKLEAGAVVPAPEPFAIAELIQDIALRFRLRAQQLGIELTTRTEPIAPSVHADVALVERVFENLLDNALRHTPAGGRVEIDAQQRDHFMEVRVSDSGAGVAAIDLPHVFERHFHRRNQAAEAGTGLGLAIVRRIVELHGGRVSMTSTPGARTAVTFSLPLAPVSDARRRPTSEQNKETAQRAR
ncbi:MAG: sensor histidine kinase [Steroidobacteraceae bacterium]